MTIVLYGSPISTFARKVAIGLELKDLPYESIDALTPDRREELHKLNPRVEVPVLKDGEPGRRQFQRYPAISGLALPRETFVPGVHRRTRGCARIRAARR